jgi:hypothetical protein
LQALNEMHEAAAAPIRIARNVNCIIAK